jgi:hypothetical protein
MHYLLMKKCSNERKIHVIKRSGVAKLFDTAKLNS